MTTDTTLRQEETLEVATREDKATIHNKVVSTIAEVAVEVEAIPIKETCRDSHREDPTMATVSTATHHHSSTQIRILLREEV